MTTTGWNGPTLPTSGDGWNLITHLTNALNTAGLIIPIASEAQRSGLAALAPGGVLPIPTTIIRTDVTGSPMEIWDGTNWNRKDTNYWQYDRSQGTDSTFSSANTNLISGTIAGAPAGLYMVTALCSLYASTTTVGYVFAKASTQQENRRWDLFDTGSHPLTAHAQMAYIHPAAGDLTVIAGYSVSSGTAAVTAVASGKTSVIAWYLGG